MWRKTPRTVQYYQLVYRNIFWLRKVWYILLLVSFVSNVRNTISGRDVNFHFSTSTLKLLLSILKPTGFLAYFQKKNSC